MNNPILMIIAGILVNAAGLAFNFYYLNIIGGIICVVGLIRAKITAPVVKKAKVFSILSIPFAALSIAMGIIAPGTSDGPGIMLGINIFFFIYFTYYFTETLIACAKGFNELAITRNFRGIWSLCGIIAFLYFMVLYSSLLPVIVTIVKIVFLISTIYFCSSINNAAKVLFPQNK